MFRCGTFIVTLDHQIDDIPILGSRSGSTERHVLDLRKKAWKARQASKVENLGRGKASSVKPFDITDV